MKTSLEDGTVISLRAPEPADLPFLYRLENDESIWTVSGNCAPYSQRQLEEYIKNSVHDLFAEHQVRFVIEVNGHQAGCIDLTDIQTVQSRAQVGVALLPEYRGQSIAASSLSLLCGYSKDRLRLFQLYALVPLSNVPSLHLFESMGFVKSGCLSDWIWLGGKYDDVAFLQKKL